MKSVYLVAAAVIVVLSACGKSESNKASAAAPPKNDPQAELVSRCVKAALDEGYRDGQCAYSFINACVTTQSKSEMEKSLQTDRLMGMATGVGCPNMPQDYVAAFNGAAKTRDKF